ncbi:MAG: A/G-specific adenine glycosylase [Oscillospiraceae bacterium]|nr:A/G-specific adenine glycosylase [Oscillospiraceae bacterium]
MDLFEQLPGALLPWYDAGHRDLPWRRDREPYHVWLSEIMLQQTRVEAVRGYYARFLAALPDIPALAAADPDVLHKLWEGLGYYARVRNLQRAAQVILEQHQGQFPADYDAVRALPGIGDYTAGAVCSICFGLPTPAVDGNVLRLAARVADCADPITDPRVKKAVAARLRAVYPAGRCGDFTQSLMELGATLCGPNAAPQCALCPCRGFCLGRARGTAAALPVKAPKRARRDEEMTVFLLWCGERVAVARRPGRGLLAGLWSFPNVPGKLEVQQALDQAAAWGVRPTDVVSIAEKEHIFTHVRWQQRGYTIRCAREGGRFVWADRRQVEEELALPTAFRQFWTG